MNRIFVALIAVAFVFAAIRELAWEPPPAVEAPATVILPVDDPDPRVATLAAELQRLRDASAPPAPAAPRSPMQSLQDAILAKARGAVDLVLGLVGAMAFFLGVMKVAERGGALLAVARAIRPILVRLFPDVPPDHPAMGAMVLNLSANALGLGNAATPFGVRAMKELDRLNPHKGTATNAMVLFLAINTSSVTLLPTGVIVWRETLGSTQPAAVLSTTLFATLCSTTVAILAARWWSRFAPTPEAITPPDDVVVLPPLEREEVGEAWPAWASWAAIGLLVACVPLTLRFGALIAPWVVPGLTIGLLGYGAVRGVPVYEAFVEGAREGWDLAVRILPYLVAILAAVGMLEASGALDAAVRVLDPITAPLGLPGAALPMALLRPLSGSGAMGVMVSTMQQPGNGPDTPVGLLVSTLMGSTETTFYVLAVYFGAVGVHRVRHAVATALTADVAGIAGAVLAVSAWFAWAA